MVDQGAPVPRRPRLRIPALSGGGLHDAATALPRSLGELIAGGGLGVAGTAGVSPTAPPAVVVAGARANPMGPAEFVERCGEELLPATVFDVFRAAAGQFGYSRVALVPVTPPAHRSLGLSELAPAVTVNVPDSWVRHYFASGYQVFDPVLLRTPHQDGPVIWDDLLARGPLSPKQRRVLTESRDAGLFNGLSIPLHGPRGETWVVSLATEDATAPAAVDLQRLHILAIQFLVSYTRSLRHAAIEFEQVRLTDRERECLTWTARGKSAWSIGKILEVSEHTVNFHLKRCMGKLGTANRMQAVVTALRLGLILP